MSLSQMQIGCLPGSQMGLTSMQREPVGVGSVVGVGAVPANMAAAATTRAAEIDLRMVGLRLGDEGSVAAWWVGWNLALGQLNTSMMTFFGLDWLNREATCLVCGSCGYVHWFLLPPVR